MGNGIVGNLAAALVQAAHARSPRYHHGTGGSEPPGRRGIADRVQHAVPARDRSWTAPRRGTAPEVWPHLLLQAGSRNSHGPALRRGRRAHQSATAVLSHQPVQFRRRVTATQSPQRRGAHRRQGDRGRTESGRVAPDHRAAQRRHGTDMHGSVGDRRHWTAPTTGAATGSRRGRRASAQLVLAPSRGLRRVHSQSHRCHHERYSPPRRVLRRASFLRTGQLGLGSFRCGPDMRGR